MKRLMPVRVVHVTFESGLDDCMLLVTSGHDNTARLFDTKSGQEVAKIAVGTDPDAALYDAASGQAVVINAKGGTLSVINVAAWRSASTERLSAASTSKGAASKSRTFPHASRHIVEIVAWTVTGCPLGKNVQLSLTSLPSEVAKARR